VLGRERPRAGRAGPRRSSALRDARGLVSSQRRNRAISRAQRPSATTGSSPRTAGRSGRSETRGTSLATRGLVDFQPCSVCACHVRMGDARCPFCGAAVAPRAVARVRTRRTSRAQWLALGAIALAGCGGRVEASPPDGVDPAATSSPCPLMEVPIVGCECQEDSTGAMAISCVALAPPPVSQGGCYGSPPARRERLA
jgi:hypothetical protein